MKKILGIVTMLLWAGTLPLIAGNPSLERDVV